MFCYLFYYTGRHNFSFATKALSDELHLSETQLGTLSGGMLICYGVGQAINGNLGDKYGARTLMALGGLLSCGLNWVTSFASSFHGILIPWMANGFAQSLGWAPGSRLLANWFEHQRRGRVFGMYLLAAGASSALTYGLCIIILMNLDFSWRWVFRLPVLLLAGGAVVFYFVARNRPEDLGYEAPSDESHHGPDPTEIPPEPGETSLQRYGHVLRHPRFLLACLAIGFESWARYGLLFWVPYHYLGPDWKTAPGGVWVTLALPIGMALGALTVGQLSDRLFRLNRSRPIALFLTAAAAVSLAAYFVPAERRMVGMVLLFSIGFCVYGPQSAFWALCPDLLGRGRAGTGVGVMNACAYGMAAVGEQVIGWTIDTTQQTGTVFLITAAASLAGAICILGVRR